MSDIVEASSSGRAAPSMRALVIGGSLAGLFTGTLLLRAGWNVDIFERSPDDLDSRGGGIVLQPEVVEVFRRAGVDLSTLALGVTSQSRVVFHPDGSIQSRRLAPQTQTSWSLIYSTMRRAFGPDNYHQGRRLVNIRQKPGGSVTAVFDDGREETGDLLVGADGSNSTVRQLLWTNAEPSYAGYLAWRGLVPEDAMPEIARETLHGDFAFANNRESHILGYLVPGERNDTREGRRFYNWVWYRAVDDAQLRDVMTDVTGRYRGYSIPEGQLAPAWREHVWRDADALLPPAFRAIVRATSQPFAQAIRDLSVDRMVKGRVILVGDAGSIPRPHTAASTSKAATNALALQAALLRLPDDVDKALASWEPQQTALGRYLLEHGRQVGNHLLFGSASPKQVG
ncbi:2-polyprenyl-6-methoxyphenol hydroxylase-like FAD-dependent oxidoreductase [Paraburkholderia sp. BL6669N2]|uniref:FAD binding domain-containing protein n=1 Tax=Paraburkholderia sp. BL6669N2 TaxID=1938807 RepID=UPI000E38FD4E|nr:FAD binding domain-containing protein [Paraburkholderia sp. BL6669N2]REG49044.1 2-polyprenyl-6-methoxyphenol hydroxylase-like FAD-dependent oxidoreductase [Paraburkholderia sp. BL6669N2]